MDSVQVARSRYSAGRKILILLAYWRMTLKLVTIARVTRMRRERFLGFQFEAFDYETLHFLFREIFVRNEYAFDGASDRPLIFDCGANIGMATVFFKWRYPRAVIHCFEPDQTTFELLERNVTANRLADVHLHNLALADAVGAVDFFVSATQNGSLLMSLDPQRSADPGRGALKRTVVDAGKLSSFINGMPVDLVKLDVEGAELAVMTDLVETGAIRRIKEMVIEYHHHVDHRRASLGDFLALFEEAGFDYQFGAVWTSPSTHEEFQDVMVRAFRSEGGR